MIDWLVIYTRSDPPCPWCVRLKELLNVYGYDFYEKDVSDEHNRKAFLEAGHRKVPQVYMYKDGDEKHLGGYDTTKDYFRNNFFEGHPNRDKILEELEDIV